MSKQWKQKPKVKIFEQEFRFNDSRAGHFCGQTTNDPIVAHLSREFPGALSGAYGHCTRCDYELELAEWLVLCALSTVQPLNWPGLFPVEVL